MNQSVQNVSPEDKYKSVSLEFLQSLPDLDIENNKNHLLAALYAVGFDIEKKFDRVEGVLVRYKHSPSHARNTTIFQGQLRDNFPYKSIYKNVDILDVDARNPKCDKEFNIVVNMLKNDTKQEVTSLPFDLPDYEGVGIEKQYSRTVEEKRRYMVANPQDMSLSELISQEVLFESPFEDEVK